MSYSSTQSMLEAVPVPARAETRSHPPRDDIQIDVNEAYGEVARSILGAVESGSAGTYRMPWNGIDRVPTNPITGRRFAGSNICALWAATRTQGYTSPYWASERAWKSKGGRLLDMEQGTAVFAPVFDETQKTGYSKKMGPIGGDPLDPSGNRLIGFKRWTVYNQAVVEGAEVAEPALPHPFTPIQAAQQVTDGFLYNAGPALVSGGAVACFVPKFDRICMPPKEAFAPVGALDGNMAYYSVLLHEMIHATSSPNRLDRKLSGTFGSSDYAKEELVAELGSAFLCARLGLATELRSNHTSYVASWLEVLKGRKGMGAFAFAVHQGGRAADFVLAKSGWVEQVPDPAEASVPVVA